MTEKPLTLEDARSIRGEVNALYDTEVFWDNQSIRAAADRTVRNLQIQVLIGIAQGRLDPQTAARVAVGWES